MSMIGNFVAISQKQLDSFIAEPELVCSFLYSEDGAEPANSLDIDKAWHAIHYTLNGTTWEGEGPLFDAVLGGQEIGDDAGYGPAKFLTPAEVRAVATALSNISAETFKARFDPRALDKEEIYPQIWERDGAEGLEYVLSYYTELVSFYQAAAERGDAVLHYIN